MMSKFKLTLLAGAFALTPLTATAQEAPVAEIVADDSQGDVNSEAYAADAKAKMQKEMDQAIALVEKMFDTSSLPPIEPARLTLAQQTMNALIPAGSLEKMIDNLYGKMFKTIMGELGGQSDLMLSIKTGVESDKIATLDEATKTRIADMFDPHRKEREDQITRVLKPLISEALTDLERPMRGGMAKAYARKFSAAQLTDLNTFLATPTGSFYASEWMELQADPEVMVAVMKALPPMVTKFMDRGPQIEKDMKELPKEKQLSDFSDKELAALAKLMKVDVKVLKEQRDMWKTESVEATAVDAAADAADYAEPTDAAADAAGDAADAAAEAAAAASDYAVDDPAYDRGNWSAADLKHVEDLEAASGNAAVAAAEAQEEAVANARKKLPD
ncbi:DUF2059 domain-containing protein [Sphingopyxis sp.]|jgi:hypothetical protein|uniref:DUF2059 domain-containing protein n=1 Tax=Sphingopyxis sp. TaxID=1908224 RepID=UPI0025F31290|nr:DUF2059 domain-containing protein [Sphingopyxis sp.]MBK6411513.1 DUF2059 domain-containing protein [Sphingopyxis sp.]